MNDSLLALEKLEKLTLSIKSADTETERAAIYSAGRWLFHDLESEFSETNTYVGEKLLSARIFFGGALGFDITNGHDQSRLITFVLGDISTAKSVLRDV